MEYSMFMERKKQRGQYRKLKSMFNEIDKFTPFKRIVGKFEEFNVPSSMFIEHRCTSGKIKTEFCKKWLETTESFIADKPSNIKFCKITSVLSFPNLWNSKIIIFYDEKYWNEFWNRTEPYQCWKPISDNISFIRKRNIKTSLQEYGFYEKLIDEDFIFQDELWFYGELPFV